MVAILFEACGATRAGAPPQVLRQGHKIRLGALLARSCLQGDDPAADEGRARRAGQATVRAGAPREEPRVLGGVRSGMPAWSPTSPK